jgi:hypothetical protein
MQPDTLKEIMEILDPDNEPGRLTLIHRFGRECIGRFLPPLIEAVRSTGKTVLWCCDPMHGNTRTTADGIKTRYFEEIPGGTGPGFRHPRGLRQPAGRHSHRTDRGERDGVHRRGARAERGGPEAGVYVESRPATELRTGAGDGAVRVAEDEQGQRVGGAVRAVIVLPSTPG